MTYDLTKLVSYSGSTAMTSQDTQLYRSFLIVMCDVLNYISLSRNEPGTKHINFVNRLCFLPNAIGSCSHVTSTSQSHSVEKTLPSQELIEFLSIVIEVHMAGLIHL